MFKTFSSRLNRPINIKVTCDGLNPIDPNFPDGLSLNDIRNVMGGSLNDDAGERVGRYLVFTLTISGFISGTWKFCLETDSISVNGTSLYFENVFANNPFFDVLISNDIASFVNIYQETTDVDSPTYGHVVSNMNGGQTTLINETITLIPANNPTELADDFFDAFALLQDNNSINTSIYCDFGDVDGGYQRNVASKQVLKNDGTMEKTPTFCAFSTHPEMRVTGVEGTQDSGLTVTTSGPDSMFNSGNKLEHTTTTDQVWGSLTWFTDSSSLGFTFPLSPAVLYCFRVALNQRVGLEFAPAFGVTYGQVNAATPMIRKMIPKSWEDEIKATAQINTIYYSYRNNAYYFRDNMTLTNQHSVMEEEMNRRIANKINRDIFYIMENYIGRINDSILRTEVSSVIERYMQDNIMSLKATINDYRITCDETNNSLEDQANNRLNLKVEIQCNSSVKFVDILTRYFSLATPLDQTA
jgi:hypothetical protein